MNPQLIFSLVTAGVELAIKLAEQRAGKSVEQMSEEEFLTQLAAIRIQSADDLIQQGIDQAGSTT